MFRYENLGNCVIEIALQGEYEIIAISNYDKVTKNNYATFYLKDKTVDMLDLMEDFASVEFGNDITALKKNIAIYITEAFNSGKFDKYFNRYARSMECFAIGNDILEKEGK